MTTLVSPQCRPTPIINLNGCSTVSSDHLPKTVHFTQILIPPCHYSVFITSGTVMEQRVTTLHPVLGLGNERGHGNRQGYLIHESVSFGSGEKCHGAKCRIFKKVEDVDAWLFGVPEWQWLQFASLYRRFGSRLCLLGTWTRMMNGN